MKTEIKLVTPEYAKTLLAGNTNNRALSQSRVNHLANQMLAGSWEFNGDTVRVSNSGRLLDGQHRLSAIIESGTSQRMIVVTGLSDSVFTTIDVGANRSASDFLAIEGFTHTTGLSAMALLFINYKRTGNPFNSTGSSKKIAKSEIVQACRDNPLLAEFTSEVGNRKNLRKIFSTSALAFSFYLFAQQDKNKAIAFMDEMESGYYSYTDSPIALLRDRLMLTKSASVTTKKLGTALIFKAWSIYKYEGKCKSLRVNQDESTWFLI